MVSINNIFNYFDYNRDKKLDKNELAELKKQQPELSDYLKPFNKDQDPSLSSEEFYNAMQALRKESPLEVSQIDLEEFKFFKFDLPADKSKLGSDVYFFDCLSKLKLIAGSDQEQFASMLEEFLSTAWAEIKAKVSGNSDFFLNFIKLAGAAFGLTSQYSPEIFRAYDDDVIIAAVKNGLSLDSLYNRSDEQLIARITNPAFVAKLIPVLTPGSNAGLCLLRNVEKNVFREILKNEEQLAGWLKSFGSFAELSDIDLLQIKSVCQKYLYDFKDVTYTRARDLEELWLKCQELDPPIEYPERFKDSGELTEIVYCRRNAFDTSKPRALMLFNKSDYNNAFSHRNHIAELLSKGYSVIYYELAKDTEVNEAFRFAGTTKPIDLVVFAAHGSPDSMEYSAPQVNYPKPIMQVISDAQRKEAQALGLFVDDIFSIQTSADGKTHLFFDTQAYCEKCKDRTLWDKIADSSILLTDQSDVDFYNQCITMVKSISEFQEKALVDVSDQADFSGLEKYCAKAAVIILESCLTGSGRESTNNVANFLKSNFPGRKVIAPTISVGVPDYLYDSRGRVIDVKYSTDSVDNVRYMTGDEP